MTRDWRAYTRTTDDGHLMWTGRRHSTTPMIYIGKQRISVPAHVYTETRRRPPIGRVLTTCRVLDCVLPEHLTDAEDRQRANRATGERLGLATLEGACPKGHLWADWAVINADGRRRCQACRHGMPLTLDPFAIEFALAGCPEDLSRPDAMETVRRAICVRGLTHAQAARLVERSPRTVTRWAVANGWRRPP